MKICFQNFLLPISFLSKTFLLPSILFFLRMRFFLQKKKKKKKNSKTILLAQFPPQKTLLLQKMRPKIPSQENLFQKEFVYLFPILLSKFSSKRICSPNFFLQTICCQTFLLSILLLTMKFYFIKSSKNFLPAKFPPHKKLLLQNLLPKISSRENLLQKEFVPHFVPFCPPNFHSKEFAPQIYIRKNLLHIFSSQNLRPNVFALHITSHKKWLPQFCSPNFFAAQTVLWSSNDT